MAGRIASRHVEESAAAVRTALLLAFADEDAAPPWVPDEAVAAAEILGLAERIAARFPGGVPDAWRDRLRREASRGMVLEATVDRLARAAEESDAVVVLLKGMALIRAGVTAPGRRPCADVDGLASETTADRLLSRLVGHGFAPLEEPEGRYHHHRAPLTHPTLGAVEIHTRLPGVQVGGSEAGADSLEAAGLLRPDPEGSALRLPDARILAAHAIAHCLYQERYLAQGVGFFRMIGDLVDLERSGGLEDSVGAARPFLERSSHPVELDALRVLIRDVREGARPADRESRRMLDRFAGACFRPEATRRRQRWRRRLHVLRMRGGLGKAWDRLRRVWRP